MLEWLSEDQEFHAVAAEANLIATYGREAPYDSVFLGNSVVTRAGEGR